MKRIQVTLPRDRWYPGTLTLRDAEGKRILAGIPCYGKADSGRAQVEGNPSRDPTKPYGDTPSGIYEPAKVLLFDPAHHRMGRWAILLEGVSGDALAARQNGRKDLAVHAGRGNYDPTREKGGLMATYGCLRLADDHMESLVGLIGDEEVEVTIEDI